jgi:V/A-type H+-transporting ATPase subunit I
MIERMKKYSFVLYHLDYHAFLADLQKLGVVHIIKTSDEKTDLQRQNLELIAEYSEAVKFLKKLSSEASKTATSLPTKALFNKIASAREEREQLQRHAELTKKHIRDLSPWGHFDYGLESRIEDYGIRVDFHTCLKNHFKPEWQEQYAIHVINELNGILYFVVFYTGDKPVLEADTFSFHSHTLQEFEVDLEETETRIGDIDVYLTGMAPTAIEMFEAEVARLSAVCEYESATLQGSSEAEDHVRVLSGWIPARLEPELANFLEAKEIIHFASPGRIEDNPPVSLRNGWFARLFEPISRMYMLPYYNEFDLTPFFAPFFMLFFGFCNADMAYGVIFILLALFLRHRSKNPAMRNMMLLVMIFGVSSIVMGWVMGSLLSFDLKNTPLNQYIFIRNNDQIFNFALLLGAIQILYGVMIKAFKHARQGGFRYFLAPFGSFLFLGTLIVMGAGLLKADISALKPYLKYPMWAGLALILLFNNPRKNLLINVLGGLWELYGIITGFFGDILSYIRLFALGVSSAILGFVINSIGQQLLGIPIAGPVIFFVFMVFGHALNIALGALSGFVHPLRLTFVEFFRNAGFNGPGLEYKPFGHKKLNS